MKARVPIARRRLLLICVFGVCVFLQISRTCATIYNSAGIPITQPHQLGFHDRSSTKIVQTFKSLVLTGDIAFVIDGVIKFDLKNGFIGRNVNVPPKSAATQAAGPQPMSRLNFLLAFKAYHYSSQNSFAHANPPISPLEISSIWTHCIPRHRGVRMPSSRSAVVGVRETPGCHRVEIKYGKAYAYYDEQLYLTISSYDMSITNLYFFELTDLVALTKTTFELPFGLKLEHSNNHTRDQMIEMALHNWYHVGVNLLLIPREVVAIVINRTMVMAIEECHYYDILADEKGFRMQPVEIPKELVTQVWLGSAIKVFTPHEFTNTANKALLGLCIPGFAAGIFVDYRYDPQQIPPWNLVLEGGTTATYEFLSYERFVLLGGDAEALSVNEIYGSDDSNECPIFINRNENQLCKKTRPLVVKNAVRALSVSLFILSVYFGTMLMLMISLKRFLLRIYTYALKRFEQSKLEKKNQV